MKESDTAAAEIRPVEQAVDILPGSFGGFSFAASEIRKVCATMLVCLSGDRDLPECRRLEKISNRRRRGAEGTHAVDRPRDAAGMKIEFNFGLLGLMSDLIDVTRPPLNGRKAS